MDQKLNAKTSVWASIAGIICGLIMLPVAIGAIASFPDSIGWLGLVLIVCSVMVSLSSFRNLKKSRTNFRATDQRVQELLSAAESPTIILSEEGFRKTVNPVLASNVLANWEYSDDEWKNFLSWEGKDRKFSSIANFLMVMAIGCILIEIKSGAGWFNSWLLSLPIATVYTWILTTFRRSSFGKMNSLRKNKIILTRHAVVINQKLSEFATEEKSIKEVRIIEEADPKVLEIEYKWLTRGVVSSDRIHIPIPKGRLGEAVLLIDKLSSPGVVFV